MTRQRRWVDRFERSRGVALAEIAISTFLVGILMVASLRALGASKRREASALDRITAQQLASALMSEITMQAFKEPDTEEAPIFGLEPGESLGNRSLFDDVDDYNGWTSSPPTARSGSPLSGLQAWRHRVTVQWADPVTLDATVSINTGVKKITVVSEKNGQTQATLIGYRTIAYSDAIPTPTDATGNHAPVAVATSPDLTRTVGQTVAFYGDTSSDQDGDYLSYVWSFGDGTTATGAIVNKVYASPGNFNCTLTVYDGQGAVSSSTLTAIISP